jgi:hypothetical protein
MTTRRVESTVDAPIWRGVDPNYPGVPQPPPGEVLTRATTRATVDYDTYTLRYASRVFWYVMLMAFGAVIFVGVAFYLQPPAAIVVGAFGIGALFGGAAGTVAVVDAHRSYTRDLAHSISETYERPQPPAPTGPATVRPFVPSAADPRTTNTGRLNFTPQVWRDLFDYALANGGTITRDRAQAAGVGRPWYHGEGWGQLLAELTRLGFIDGRNRLTPAALQWYADAIPLPLATIPTRSRIERTNGANERTNGPDSEEWGE